MIYLYARVSTDKQEHGREAQLSRLREWAKDKEIGGEFVEEDVSAAPKHPVTFRDEASIEGVFP